MAANRVIGHNGKLPWHLPEDLQRFRALTLNQAVIMGRKTWEFDLEKRLLPQRTMIVVSRSLPDLVRSPTSSPDVLVVPSISAALSAVPAHQQAFIIGGAAIYAQTLALADRLELTQLDQPMEGDTLFPEYEALVSQDFELIQVVPRSGYRFLTYQRTQKP